MSAAHPVIIITGASGNVGRASVDVLAASGARLACVVHHRKSGDSLVSERADGENHMVLHGVDLTDPTECQMVARKVLAHYGRIDGLAHTVGGFAAAPLAESDSELWVHMFRVNVLTTLHMV